MRPSSARKTQAPGDKGSRVQVGVRIRPLNRSDGQDDRVVIHSDGAGSRTVTVDDVAGRRSRSFEYDFVFEGQQQSDVYDAIGAPMLEEAYKGFNVCLFAYGQTGSGKTFSIQGEQESEDKQGIIPRFVRSMFREAQRRVEEDSTTTIKITMSMIEIYMEKVRDLLIPRVRGQEPESLDVQEDQNHKIVVRNVGVHSVLSADRVAELLAFGNANRQTAETKMNEMSSRSHSIVQFTILQLSEAVDRRDIESVVSLVDLAGSERQGKTETTGLQFEESKKINHSLLMLGRALNSFSEGKTDAFISLRESKLTRLLSESFGGNSKTWMLATISPSQFNATESISTLEYAQNALSITNKAEVNRKSKQLEIGELRQLVESLERKLEIKKSSKERVVERIQNAKNIEESLLEALSLVAKEDQSFRRNQASADELENRNRALRLRLDALENNGAERRKTCFKGRCAISLANVLSGQSETFSLRLDEGHSDALLVVELSPVGSVENLLRRGTALRFTVNVIQAAGIPEEFSQRTYCRYSLSHDPDCRWYRTDFAAGTEPKWNFLKQFELVDLTPELIDCFEQESVFSFEVYGLCS